MLIHFITCKSFNICKKNANVLVAMYVDFVELVRLKMSHSLFFFNVFNHLFSYEIWQHYMKKKSEIKSLLKFIDVPIKNLEFTLKSGILRIWIVLHNLKPACIEIIKTFKLNLTYLYTVFSLHFLGSLKIRRTRNERWTIRRTTLSKRKKKRPLLLGTWACSVHSR